MNWNLKSTKNIKALIIVAHPDDETIFCGGTMLFYPHWNWSIICMTQVRDSERYRQFVDAVESFKGLGVNITFYKTFEKQSVIREEMSESEILIWEEDMRKDNIKADIVFTHNISGEYGHSQHKALSKITSHIYENVWEFICPGAVNVVPQPYREFVNVVPLSKQILKQKTAVFNSCYRSELCQWVYLSDLMLYEFKTGPEMFTSGDSLGC